MLLAAGATLASRARRRRLLYYLAAEGRRFVLRLHATGAAERVVLGTSLEEADATPDHEPDLVAVEVELEDDGENRVIVPAGARLRVRSFEGAHRAVQDHQTTPEGTLARRTFEVPPRLDFWILDAPGFGALPAAAGGGPRPLPARDEPWEVTTRKPPVLQQDLARQAPPLRWPVVLALFASVAALFGEAGEVVALCLEALVGVRTLGLVASWAMIPRDASGERPDREPRLTATMARCECPLWAYRLRDVEEWLLPRRRSAGRVIVVDMVDQHSPAEEVTDRDDLVGAAALVLADELWARTDLRAVAALPVVVGRARVHRTNEPPPFEAHASLIGQFPEGPTVLVWGAAQPDVGRDGYVVRVRAAEGPHAVEQELRGTLPVLAEAVVDWLVAAGFCQRVDVATPFATPAEADAYSLALDRLFLQSLMHPRNRALPPLEASWHAESLALAERVTAASPGNARAGLARLVCGIYAHEAGALDDAARERLLGLVRGAEPTDPLHRLAPMLLERFGRLEEARALAAERRSAGAGSYRDEGGAYASWLDRIGEAD